MVVCHCLGVNDRAIREAARGGATQLLGVARQCGAGGGCGGCHHTILEILEEEALRAAAHAPVESGHGADRAAL